jgi:septal ring factor EnvC (AmiA/AmiB activator)
VTKLEGTNVRMKSELEHSSRALSELQSLYDKQNTLYKGLKNERNNARSHVEALEAKIVEVEEAVAANAAVEEHYAAYRTRVKEDMISLRGAYDHALNDFGGLCLPIDDGASSTDDFIRWFESKVAMLPKIFAIANKNFVSVALEGVLDMVKQ